MKNEEEDKTLSKYKKMFRFTILLIIEGLYSLSAIFMAYGVVVLIIIVLFGGINIENGQVIASGILLFFPLHYLKRFFGGEDFSSLVRHKK